MLEILAAFIKLRRSLSLAHVQCTKPLGLGSKQAHLLRVLHACGPCSAGSLARATVSDPAAIHRAVGVLVKKGLVLRTADSKDGRRCSLRLSAAGETMALEVLKRTERLAQDAFSALDETRRALFLEDLRAVAAHVDARLAPLRTPGEEPHDEA